MTGGLSTASRRSRGANGLWTRTGPLPAVVMTRPVMLSSFTGVRRMPVRPAAHRQPDFDDKFDADTLFYDAFRGIDGRIVLVGPPFLNLEPAVRGQRVQAFLRDDALCVEPLK